MNLNKFSRSQNITKSFSIEVILLYLINGKQSSPNRSSLADKLFGLFGVKLTNIDSFAPIRVCPSIQRLRFGARGIFRKLSAVPPLNITPNP